MKLRRLGQIEGPRRLRRLAINGPRRLRRFAICFPSWAGLWGVVFTLCLCLFLPPAHAQGATAAAGDDIESRKIEALRFRGNRKVESEAMQLNLSSEVGETVSRKKVQDDIRAVWKMGYFNDVRVEVEEGKEGVILIFAVREKPAVRKIYVAGNSEVGLDKINEVLDLKKDKIYDPAQVKRNAEKIHDLYVEKGYYLADVKSDIKNYSPTQVDVYFIVDERAKVEVRQVRFIGNRHIAEAELKGSMQTQEGGWLSFLTSTGTYREDAFDRDLLLLTAAYYDRGYVNVKVGKPQIELSADKRYLYITIPLEEGDIYKIGKLDFKGELLWPRDVLLHRLAVKSGEVFNRTKLGNDIIKVNDAYKDRGYAYVNVTPLTAVDVDKRTVDLTFDIQTGAKVFFERINIRGNSKTRDKVIRREMKVSEGELFSQTFLDLSKKRIQALGFFEKVELSTKRGTKEDRIEVNLEVTERPTGTFQIGAGFSSIENFIGQAQVAQNNLFGRGTTMQLQAQISSLRQLFSVRYVDPYFLDTNVTFAFSGYNQLLYYPSFNRTTRGGDLTWGYLLSDFVRVFGTYKLEWVSVGQNQSGVGLGGIGLVTIPSNTVANLYGRGWTSAVRFALNYDSRNDRLFPTRGMFHSLSVEVADRYLASEKNYVRVTGTGQFYRPIWGPFIFRLRLDTGVVISRSPDGVPIYERYFLGGINSIRGYRLFSLGPKISPLSQQNPDAFQQPFNFGANWQIVLNSEIEFLILPAVQIKGVVFFDAGNGYNLERRYCPSAASSANIAKVFNPCEFYPTFQNLRYSVGFGFRWFSPIGPLRFEWGIPLNKQQGEDSIVFEFTIGNFF